MLGVEVLVAGLAAWAGVSVLHRDSFKRMDAEFRDRALPAAAMGQAAIISIWVAGGVLIESGPVGVYWLVPGLLLSYLVALANAWVLIVEINR